MSQELNVLCLWEQSCEHKGSFWSQMHPPLCKRLSVGLWLFFLTKRSLIKFVSDDILKGKHPKQHCSLLALFHWACLGCSLINEVRFPLIIGAFSTIFERRVTFAQSQRIGCGFLWTPNLPNVALSHFLSPYHPNHNHLLRMCDGVCRRVGCILQAAGDFFMFKRVHPPDGLFELTLLLLLVLELWSGL